jgi:hypothetical protein
MVDHLSDLEDRDNSIALPLSISATLSADSGQLK